MERCRKVDSKLWRGSIMSVAAQRSATAAFHNRFTLGVTRRTVPIMFSIAVVQASERRSGPEERAA